MRTPSRMVTRLPRVERGDHGEQVVDDLEGRLAAVGPVDAGQVGEVVERRLISRDSATAVYLGDILHLVLVAV